MNARTRSLPARSTQWNLLVTVTHSPSFAEGVCLSSASSFGAGLVALLSLNELDGLGSNRLSPGALGVEGLEPGTGLLTLPIELGIPLCLCAAEREGVPKTFVWDVGGECFSALGEF